MLVASPRWSIDKKKIEFAPFHIFQKLLYQAILLWTSPYDCIISVGQHELHAHNAQVLHYPNGAPARTADVNSFRLHSHHLWYTGSTDISIHHSNRIIRIGSESVCQEACKC